MSMFFGSPQVGDHIKTTKRVKVTFTDFLLGDDGGIKPGTRGVITGTTGWNSLQAHLNTGFGGVNVTLKAHQVRVVRRGAGVEQFHETTARINAVRMGVAMAFIAPLLFFAASWFIHGGSKDGFISAMIGSAIYGVFDLLAYALSNPINAIVYIGIVTVAGRFAFRM